MAGTIREYKCNKCNAQSTNPARCPDKNCKGQMEAM